MRSKCDRDVVEMLSDANRFILAHAEMIAESALHVYYSALPFVPRNTLLYGRYWHEGAHSVTVLQGVEFNWSHYLAILQGHKNVVHSVGFSPDGLQLASGSWDRTIRLWDVMPGTQTAILEGHSAEVLFVAFSPDGLQLASGSCDGTIRLWDVMSRTNTAILEGHSGGVCSVMFSPVGGQRLGLRR
jgi:WD40 repeat protein